MANMIFEGRNRVTSCFQLPVRPNHNGIDIVGDDNKIVRATTAGTVLQSRIVTDKSNATWEWGQYVSIQDANGLVHYYCHLVVGSQKVKSGDKVSAGQALGTMGNSGYSQGAHTHYEVRKNNKAINPAPYAGVQNKTGTYTSSTSGSAGSSNSGSGSTNNSTGGFTLRLLRSNKNQTPRSSLLKEHNAIRKESGNPVVYSPQIARGVNANNISPQYEDYLYNQAQVGDIIIAFENGKSTLRMVQKVSGMVARSSLLLEHYVFIKTASGIDIYKPVLARGISDSNLSPQYEDYLYNQASNGDIIFIG